MNARVPETQNTAAANSETAHTPQAVTAVQEEIAKNVDNSVGQAYNQESSKNRTEANPNAMNATNPEAANNTLHRTPETNLAKVQSLLRNLDTALNNGADTKNTAKTVAELKTHGIILDAHGMMTDAKTLRAQLKNLQAVMDWTPENTTSTMKALNALENLSKTWPAQTMADCFAEANKVFYENTTLGLHSLKNQWQGMSPQEQILYLESRLTGATNRLTTFLQNGNPMVYTLSKFVQAARTAQGLAQEWTSENGRQVDTLASDDLVSMILLGLLPTQQYVISQLEKMMQPDQFKTVANKVIYFGTFFNKTAATAEVGMTMVATAGAFKAGMTLQSAFFTACERMRAERSAVASVQNAEEAAAMGALDAANNNEHYRQAA